MLQERVSDESYEAKPRTEHLLSALADFENAQTLLKKDPAAADPYLIDVYYNLADVYSKLEQYPPALSEQWNARWLQIEIGSRAQPSK